MTIDRNFGITATLLAISAGCTVVATGTTVAARTAAVRQAVVDPKTGPVGGWDSTETIIVAALAVGLMLVAVAALENRKRAAGAVAVSAAATLVVVLWFDRYAVWQTPGVIEGGGPGNIWTDAAIQLADAGWLLAAVFVLCTVVIVRALSAQSTGPRYRSSGWWQL